MYAVSKPLSLGGYVHCECAVVARVDAFLREHPASEGELIPYIGISKRPCLLCNDYIVVYNSLTGRNIRTARTHGQAVPWRRPILKSDKTEETVRTALYSCFADRLKKKISSSARSSLDSQTTGNGSADACFAEETELSLVPEGRRRAIRLFLQS